MKRPAAARSMASPPGTEPVKQTWPMRGSRIIAGRGVMGQVNGLQQASRQASFGMRPGKGLRAKRGLLGMFQQHGIPGHEGRHDGIDRRQQGIVPWRDDQHNADRITADEPPEAGLSENGDIGQAVRRQADHHPRRSSKPRHSLGV